MTSVAALGGSAGWALIFCLSQFVALVPWSMFKIVLFFGVSSHPWPGLVGSGWAEGWTKMVSMHAVATPETWLNAPTCWLLGVVVGALAIANVVVLILKRQADQTVDAGLLRRFELRVRAWWMMCVILISGFLLQYLGTIVLFGIVSFWALREFITLTPTRRGDHRTLFWVLVVFTPLQYVLVGLGSAYYELYSIAIPVYGFLFIPARIAMSGDHKRFLERSAKISVGLLICVYSLSYAPALLDLELMTWKPAPATGTLSTENPELTIEPLESEPRDATSEELRDATSRLEKGDRRRPWKGSPAGLLFFFVLVVQLGDIFQYSWGQVLGRRMIAPDISRSRTWEGFLGGIATTTMVGASLWWVTPFRLWEAACMSLVIAVMGFCGGMTMSAIKRDRGVADTGTLVQGHAGVLDRIDSICFSAPVFFHLTRFFFSNLA
jgi:phosphatidate cytidylyltransferase